MSDLTDAERAYQNWRKAWPKMVVVPKRLVDAALAALRERLEQAESGRDKANAKFWEQLKRADTAEAENKQLRKDSRSYWKLVAERSEAELGDEKRARVEFGERMVDAEAERDLMYEACELTGWVPETGNPELHVNDLAVKLREAEAEVERLRDEYQTQLDNATFWREKSYAEFRRAEAAAAEKEVVCADFDRLQREYKHEKIRADRASLEVFELRRRWDVK